MNAQARRRGGRRTDQAFARLGSPARGMARHGRSAVVASLLVHALVLLGVLALMRPGAVPSPAPEPAIEMAFMEQPTPVQADAPASEPAAVNPEPAPAPAEAASTPAEPEPPPEPPPPQTQPEPQAPSPARLPARPFQPPKPRSTAVARTPAEAAHPTQTPSPTAMAAAALAPMLPAHPVAGMESDRPPTYPENARRRGQQGRVVLQVNVSPEGLPVAVTVAQSSGVPSLDAAALSAVQRWRFVPATRGGAPIAATAEVPIQFRLID